MGKAELLAIFEVEGNKYNIYGNYEIENDTDYMGNPYMYPEFSELSAKQIVDGKEVDFKPTGCTWTGRGYVVEDMISDFLAKEILDSKFYKTNYIESGLQKIIDYYHREDNIVTIRNGLRIPKYILSNEMFGIYELTLVTNEYIYYMYADRVLMFSTDTHEVVSDNYFAEVGYWDSIQNIDNNTETLIWGELPEAV